MNRRHLSVSSSLSPVCSSLQPRFYLLLVCASNISALNKSLTLFYMFGLKRTVYVPSKDDSKCLAATMLLMCNVVAGSAVSLMADYQKRSDILEMEVTANG